MSVFFNKGVFLCIYFHLSFCRRRRGSYGICKLHSGSTGHSRYIRHIYITSTHIIPLYQTALFQHHFLSSFFKLPYIYVPVNWTLLLLIAVVFHMIISNYHHYSKTAFSPPTQLHDMKC